MIQTLKYALFPIGLLFVLSCSQGDQPFVAYSPDSGLKILSENKSSERLIYYHFMSPSIAKNKIGDSGESQFAVYLPKSYFANPEKRYPVVYGLHSYRSNPNEIVLSIMGPLDKDPKAPESIIVGINGTNSLSASFYANSPASGNWEDMVAYEVPYLIDQKFRTIKSSNSRMLIGFSMGGGAAWNIGLKHPDIFGTIWAGCPGALAPGKIRDGLSDWFGFTDFLPAYAVAFAPDMNRPESKYYRLITHFDEPSDPSWGDYLAKLESGFGDIDKKISAYQKLGRKLNSVRVAWAQRDIFLWIPEGSKYLANALEKAHENAKIESFDVEHDFDSTFVTESLIPYLKESFK